MLLEKSSPAAGTDEQYRKILPPELAGLKLPPQIVEEIVAAVCDEVARNPDVALLSVLSFVGTDLSVKTLVGILIHPPRSLNADELDVALSIVAKFLPYRLSANRKFLPRETLHGLIRLVKRLQKVGDPQRTSVVHFSEQLQKSLFQMGSDRSR
jgi:hypothetical protein